MGTGRVAGLYWLSSTEAEVYNVLNQKNIYKPCVQKGYVSSCLKDRYMRFQIKDKRKAGNYLQKLSAFPQNIHKLKFCERI